VKGKSSLEFADAGEERAVGERADLPQPLTASVFRIEFAPDRPRPPQHAFGGELDEERVAGRVRALVAQGKSLRIGARRQHCTLRRGVHSQSGVGQFGEAVEVTGSHDVAARIDRQVVDKEPVGVPGLSAIACDDGAVGAKTHESAAEGGLADPIQPGVCDPQMILAIDDDVANLVPVAGSLPSPEHVAVA